MAHSFIFFNLAPLLFYNIIPIFNENMKKKI